MDKYSREDINNKTMGRKKRFEIILFEKMILLRQWLHQVV
jgi:hypothetical protein